MNFFKRKTGWTNFELALFKICLLSIGALSGIYLYEFINAHTKAFWIISITTTIVVGYLWLQKTKQR